MICRTGEPFHKTMSFLFLWNTKTLLRCCAGEASPKNAASRCMLRRNPLHDHTTSSRRPFGSCTYCHNVSRALMVDRYPGNPEYPKWTPSLDDVVWSTHMRNNARNMTHRHVWKLGPTLCHSFYISFCCWLLPSLTEDRLVVLRLSVAAAGTPTVESS